MISLVRNPLKKELKRLGIEIQDLILNDKLLSSKIDQEGIKDGAQIISEYVDQNELELAFEQLHYMITESEIQLSKDQSFRVDKMARKIALHKLIINN